MARDGREVEAVAPSGGRGIRRPEERGSRARRRRGQAVGGGAGSQEAGEALAVGSGFSEARSGVRRSGGGSVRWPGRGSTSPNLVEAGSGGGGIRQSLWEALAAGSGFPKARFGVRRSGGGSVRRPGRGSTSPTLWRPDPVGRHLAVNGGGAGGWEAGEALAA
uniref:Uncharacterized protein n=1 Tax=Oryza meridionalis TaxID=40149 RepID=A0A0E0EPG8_9ORYZ